MHVVRSFPEESTRRGSGCAPDERSWWPTSDSIALESLGSARSGQGLSISRAAYSSRPSARQSKGREILAAPAATKSSTAAPMLPCGERSDLHSVLSLARSADQWGALGRSEHFLRERLLQSPRLLLLNSFFLGGWDG